MAPVRGDQVMQVLLLGAPLPPRHDDVALESLWPRRLAVRQLALGDAFRPVGVILERCAAEVLGKLGQHLLAGLPRLNATHPRLFVRLEFPQSRRQRARGLLTQRVTADAADVLHLLEPVDLGEFFWDVALAAELA